MKHVKIQRAFQTDHITLGMLQVQGVDHRPIYTLENPWINNKPYVSCIPADTYLCQKHSGFKYKDVWQLMGVPNRSAILIHYGNFEHDTQGCIIVGLSTGKLNGQDAVLHSRDAVDLLRSILGKKEFSLEIQDIGST